MKINGLRQRLGKRGGWTEQKDGGTSLTDQRDWKEQRPPGILTVELTDRCGRDCGLKAKCLPRGLCLLHGLKGWRKGDRVGFSGLTGHGCLELAVMSHV